MPASLSLGMKGLVFQIHCTTPAAPVPRAIASLRSRSAAASNSERQGAPFIRS